MEGIVIGYLKTEGQKLEGGEEELDESEQPKAFEVAQQVGDEIMDFIQYLCEESNTPMQDFLRH